MTSHRKAGPHDRETHVANNDDWKSGYQHLEFERDGQVLTVRINGADRMNAVNAKLHTELSTVFNDIDDHDDCTVVVLTGAGNVFCAGGDLEWISQMAEDPHSFDVTGKEGRRLLETQLSCSKPIIAAVNGHAVGLGATMALFCDLVIAVDTAKIGDPHVRVGLTAGDGGAVIWPYLVGFARAKEYLLTGKLLSGTKAAEIGLINAAVPAEEFDAAVKAMCDELLASPRRAVSLTKRTINMHLSKMVGEMMEASFAFEDLAHRSEDHREAVRALIEKRTPVFTGN